MATATIRYNTLPSLDVLRIGLHNLNGPFSVEIRQPSDDGEYADYAEYIDAGSVDDLYDFLSEELMCKDLPFTIDVEEIEPSEQPDSPYGPKLRPAEAEWASEAHGIS